MSGRRWKRRWIWLIGSAAVAISGCGGSSPRTAANSHALTIVTSGYPLAQAASFIGAGRAHVIDLVPAASNPFSFNATPTEVSEIQKAGLFLFTAPTVQPGLATVSSAATQTVDVSAATSEPYFWLDPIAMRTASQIIEAAMERVDPADGAAFRSGAHDLEIELDSTGIDYQNTLSTCPRRTLFEADTAFAGVASRYNLDFTALGTSPIPSAGALAAEAASVRSSGATAVFTETWVADSTVQSVASSAQVKVRTLDTLLAPPPGGWPRQATYLNLLESNLGHLSDALGCAGSNLGT